MNKRLTYNYAKIKVSTRQCRGVFTSSDEMEDSSLYEYVRLDSYNEEYLLKYYINGAWYEDAEGTIPFTPAE